MEKVRLTYNEFKKVIFESVYNILDNTLLLEYLVQRKDFVNLLWNLSDQIIENWCLVHYCTVVGQSEYKKHWTDELKGYLKRISRTGIKSSNDFDSRRKCVLQAFAMNSGIPAAACRMRLCTCKHAISCFHPPKARTQTISSMPHGRKKLKMQSTNNF